MIKLTGTDGKEVYVNPFAITYIEEYEDGSDVRFSEHEAIFVKEEPLDVAILWNYEISRVNGVE